MLSHEEKPCVLPEIISTEHCMDMTTDTTALLLQEKLHNSQLSAIKAVKAHSPSMHFTSPESFSD